MGIDRRKNYGIMLDTETANTIQDGDKLDMSNVLPYDFGWAVIDSKGNVYETYSFVNRDIFCYERDLMQSAYYADKIPRYVEDIKNGSRVMADLYDIRQAFCDCVERYNCSFVCAHNMRFDLNACNNAQRWDTKSKYRYFFPYGLEVWDTLKMARQVIGKMPTYRDYCEKNGYKTKNGQLRFTAEILYRFISGEDSFDESHTGLEDVLIEVEILKYCVRQHKEMEKSLFKKPEVERPMPTDFQRELMRNIKDFPMVNMR